LLGDVDGDLHLFHSIAAQSRSFGTKGMRANDIHRMVRRRLLATGLPVRLFTCHNFRATTATDLLERGVEFKKVQHFLGHRDPRTTALYDRRKK
jgi:integrase